MGPTAMGRIFSVLQATSVATLAAADAAATLTRTATLATVAAIAEDLMRHCPDETACIFLSCPGSCILKAGASVHSFLAPRLRTAITCCSALFLSCAACCAFLTNDELF